MDNPPAALASRFSDRLLGWFDQCGRKDLPWSGTKDPYPIWVSEIMLQQTQVATVIDYFKRFMQRFPDVETLSRAPIDEVLHLWTGLGYYARARNMHKAAQMVVAQYSGQFPKDIDQLMALPGIGRSTAGAILAFSDDQRHPILDGNVKRVLTRLQRIKGRPGQTQVQQQLWTLAALLTPSKRVTHYTQAIMDLGATVCVRRAPLCDSCPVSQLCLGFQAGDTKRFPFPAVKKLKPVKTTGMLIIQNAEGEVLLEQRPPSGIWGGLWGLPECDNGLGEHRQWEYSALGATLKLEKPWAVKRHTFTHFHLDITPIPAQIEDYSDGVMENSKFVWYKPKQPQAIGLAAPVKSLIQQLK